MQVLLLLSTPSAGYFVLFCFFCVFLLLGFCVFHFVFCFFLFCDLFCFLLLFGSHAISSKVFSEIWNFNPLRFFVELISHAT